MVPSGLGAASRSPPATRGEEGKKSLGPEPEPSRAPSGPPRPAAGSPAGTRRPRSQARPTPPRPWALSPTPVRIRRGDSRPHCVARVDFPRGGGRRALQHPAPPPLHSLQLRSHPRAGTGRPGAGIRPSVPGEAELSLTEPSRAGPGSSHPPFPRTPTPGGSNLEGPRPRNPPGTGRWERGARQNQRQASGFIRKERSALPGNNASPLLPLIKTPNGSGREPERGILDKLVAGIKKREK